MWYQTYIKYSFTIFLVLFILLSGNVSDFETQKAHAVDQTTLIVHYKPNPNSNENWSVWSWTDSIAGAAVSFTSKDSFGLIAKKTFPELTDKIGFIIRTEDWKKDIGDDRFATPDLNELAEIWLVSGNPTVFTKEPGANEVNKVTEVKLPVNITFHYQRNDKNYLKWSIWAWQKGEDGRTCKFEGADDFGAIAVCSLPKADEQVGFIIKDDSNPNEWIKDVTTDRVVQPNGQGRAEVWLLSGDMTIYMKPPSKSAQTAAVINSNPVEVTFHYLRNDQYYNNWSVYAWYDGTSISTNCIFNEKDTYGAIAICKFPKGKQKVGFVVKDDHNPKNWIKDIAFDRFIDLQNNKGEVWLVNGDVNIYKQVPTSGIRKSALASIIKQFGTNVTVHYHRLDKNYSAWGVWSWGLQKDEAGGLFKFTQEDEFGGLANILWPKTMKSMGLVIKKDNPLSSAWIKDGTKDRLIAIKDGKSEIWIYENDPVTYQTRPINSIKLTLHYKRNASDYSDWVIYYGTKKEDRVRVTFGSDDEYGKTVNLTLPIWKLDRMLLWVEKANAKPGAAGSSDGSIRSIQGLKDQMSADYWIRQGDLKVYSENPNVKK